MAARTEPDVAALRAHVRTLVAGYEVPKEIHVLDTMQCTPPGKPDHRGATTRASALAVEAGS
jgi:3-oxocholest-4-en-26-oate---CoA ligase